MPWPDIVARVARWRAAETRMNTRLRLAHGAAKGIVTFILTTSPFMRQNIIPLSEGRLPEGDVP